MFIYAVTDVEQLVHMIKRSREVVVNSRHVKGSNRLFGILPHVKIEHLVVAVSARECGNSSSSIPGYAQQKMGATFPFAGIFY